MLVVAFLGLFLYYGDKLFFKREVYMLNYFNSIFIAKKLNNQ
jgi:hypothetical protein